jgi:hypothetical protein
MALSIENRAVGQIFIVDDDATAREACSTLTSDLGIVPAPVDGPIESLEALLSMTRGTQTAAIADHHLKVSNYATFDGAQLVAAWYAQKTPALLCTRWELADIDEIRSFRAHIPVLLTPARLDVDSIISGITVCLREFDGVYLPSRKPWRTLVRTDAIDERFVYVVLSGWRPDEVVRLLLRSLPSGVAAVIQQGKRIHAKVNIGAEKQEDLYFTDWEES